MPDTFAKSVEASKKAIKKKQAAEVKKETDEAQTQLDAEFAFTPKQGFDWDNVSGAITDVVGL